MRRVFSCDMSKSSRTGKPGKTGKARVRKKGSAGPIAFFVSLFIIALGTIQLVSTFHTYALNLAELNGLKREEASLIAEKQELENDIKRWDDKATSPPRPVNASASYSPANRPCVCFIPKP